MSRVWYFTLAWLMVGFLACTPDHPSDPSPNILLIVADDLGYEQLGSYGGLGVKTPNLDAMADRGVRFSRAYTSGVCTPSRMSLYTSLYPSRHGYTTVLPVHLGTQRAVDFQAMPTYAQQLQQKGYHTAVTGKWQLATLEYHPVHIRSAGYDSWCVWQIWRDSAKTRRYWEATYNQDGEIRTDIADRFGPDVMAEYVIDQMVRASAAGKPFAIQHNMVLPHTPIIETPTDRALGREPSLPQMVTYLDRIVGRLLAAVDSLGIAEHTYVLFVGDNGTESKDIRQTEAGPVVGGKWDLNDAGMHVPLLALVPGQADGRVDPSLVDMVDLFPTLCELAGIDLADQKIDGQSFVAPLLGTGVGSRAFVSGAIKDEVVVFDGAWRLSHPSMELMDCRNLPQEVVADSTEPAAQEARQRLEKLLLDMLQP